MKALLDRTRQYHTMAEEYYDRHTDKDGFILFGTFPSFREPQTGDWWGNWRYNKKFHVIEYYANNTDYFCYQIPLDDLDWQEVGRWCLHLTGKSWLNPEQIGHLVYAFNDIGNLML